MTTEELKRLRGCIASVIRAMLASKGREMMRAHRRRKNDFWNWLASGFSRAAWACYRKSGVYNPPTDSP